MGAEGAAEILFRRDAPNKADMVEAYRKIDRRLHRRRQRHGRRRDRPARDPSDDHQGPARWRKYKDVQKPKKRHGVMPVVSIEDPVILTCAVSGAVATRDQCPAIPYTPAEYAAEARRTRSTRARVMIHIHARTPDGTPSLRGRGLRARSREAITAPRSGDVINYSTGRARRPDRASGAYLRALRPDVGRAEHGLDELREVLEAAQRLRLQDRVRELASTTIVDAAGGDERGGHQARARVLRHRPRRQRSTRCCDKGVLGAAAAGVVRDGRDRRHPADRAQPRAHGREHPRWPDGRTSGA